MKAKSRQAHRDRAGTAPKIQSVQRPCGLRQNVLQVGKGEIEAQSALGRLEIAGVLRCAGPEPFEVVIGGHFRHAPLRRSRPVRVAGEQSVYRKDQERQVLVLYLRRPVQDRQSNRGALEGRFRYSDLKDAAPRGSLWVLYMAEQVLTICKVAVGGCVR